MWILKIPSAFEVCKENTSDSSGGTPTRTFSDEAGSLVLLMPVQFNDRQLPRRVDEIEDLYSE